MTFRQLGLSIYPDHSDFTKDKQYLELGKKYGYSRLFMSMLEAEDIPATKEKFTKIVAVAKDLGYLTIIDISPRIFEKLKISYQNLRFFAELGVDGIRLDQGFDGNTEALISYNPYGLIIELNMSNDVAYLENILSYQANKPYLFGCHNFYPQVGTGLTEEFFLECSERFKKNGIHTAAFVASQHGEQGPWNVNDGLPTLESDRHLPIDVQAKKIFATGLIDDVIIGNAYATEEELKALADVDRYQLQLKVDFLETTTELEWKIACEMQHFRRGDTNALVARSTQSR
ncbi:MAG: MupG family TIM beta-alpha barrel fold protein, partial [Enterococcus sp.]|nr:MupG family TIM beta-alpha barrel fold protein [Enterococcus sp.]